MSDHESTPTTEDVRSHVRQRYGQLAQGAKPAAASSCCAPQPSRSSCCGPAPEAEAPQASDLYQAQDLSGLPEEVTDLSLGCGDPVTLASLQEGQTVLDLGSGGGIDCFLAARKVGPSGKVIGVDMTPEMIERARSNKARMGAGNVEFRLGEIEHLPVSDGIVDVVISNCVINLSPDKPQVFREAFRVLRPGGRLAVSDIVTDGPLPEAVKSSISAWAGCIAGALEAKDYLAAIEQAGFEQVELTPVYWDAAMIRSAAEQIGLSEQLDLDDPSLLRAVFSAKVKARKPLA